MSDVTPMLDLDRALQISRQLAAAADGGEVRVVAELDAERLRLLHSAGCDSRILDSKERAVLLEISQLNDKAIGLLEHRRRRTEREMDTAAVGRRALAAYGSHA